MRSFGKPRIDIKVIVYWSSVILIPTRAVVGRGKNGEGAGAEKVDLRDKLSGRSIQRIE
jgi:hypothetical protein